MLQSFYATRSPGTEIFCYVEETDPQREAYEQLFESYGLDHEFGPWRTMVQAVNYGCRKFEADFYGVLNDDHVCHTPGWDSYLAVSIIQNGGTGMGCGRAENRENLPQIILISRDCVRALGWYLPPQFIHQYVDNVQADLYGAAGLMFNAGDVWIEHVHPDFGKAPMDSTYQIMRNAHFHDRGAYEVWKREGGFEADLAKLMKLKKV